MKCKACGKMNCMAHGGRIDMYAMEPDVPSMHGYDEGGDVSRVGGGEKHDEPMDESGIDDELNDMAAQELMDAFTAKDKKGVLEAIRALVLNCKG